MLAHKKSSLVWFQLLIQNKLLEVGKADVFMVTFKKEQKKQTSQILQWVNKLCNIDKNMKDVQEIWRLGLGTQSLVV